MPAEVDTKSLEKNYRLSKQAIPVYVGLLIISIFTLWIFSRFVSIPVWISVIIVGMTVFTLVGDILNCFYCARKLKQIRDDGRS